MCSYFLSERNVQEMADMAEPDASASSGLAGPYDVLFNQEAWEVDAEPLAVDEVKQTPSAPVSPPPLVRIVEALLFVGGSPLSAERACAAIRGLTPEQFDSSVDALNRDYRRQGRPYTIQTGAQGCVLVLRPGFKAVAERLYGQTREARLSPAAIDVLSLVAYRQPVAKQEVDSIRGMESGSLLRQLVRRGLIAVVQRGEATKRQVAYGTTQRFLNLFKLRSLDDLPQTQDLQKL
jgi:segregation and condensation protein B